MNDIDVSTLGPRIKRRMRSRWFRIWWRRVNSWTDQDAKKFALLKIHEIKWDPRFNSRVNKQMITTKLNQKSRAVWSPA